VRKVVGEGGARGVLRKRAMKARVEARHLGHVWKNLRGEANDFKCGRHVNRGKWNGSFELVQHLWRDEPMLAELRTAVDHTMADDVGSGHRTLMERLGKKFSRFLCRPKRAVLFYQPLLALPRPDAAVLASQSFGRRGCQRFFPAAGHGIYAGLQRRRAAVEYQNDFLLRLRVGFHCR